MSVFNGSIAQKNVQFPIETVIEPINGENYSKAMIFITATDAASFLSGIVSPEAGALYELKSTNYNSIAGGALKAKLKPFFDKAANASVGIAVFNEPSSTTIENDYLLAEVYEKYKMFAFFKFNIFTEYDARQALSLLCLADPLYSDLWIGTNDTNVLDKSSTIITQLNNDGSRARVIYNPDTSIDPALAQLGATLGTINSTGTPIGNSIDMVAFDTIKASGALNADNEREDLTALQVAALDDQHIGYNTWVGNGTENVVTEGSLNLKGESVCANWIKQYITYMCKVNTATYITQMNVYLNNESYQAILLILFNQVDQFVKLGRLSKFRVTAPEFADLPKGRADVLTVPNAWQATFVDNIRDVTIYGTLYITQPTR